MITPSPEQFSFQEVQEALTDVVNDPIDIEVIANNLRAIAESRRLAAEQGERVSDMRRLAIAWNNLERRGDSEDLASTLERCSANYLCNCRERKDGLSELEKTAREAAAFTYTIFTFQKFDIPDESLLTGAGIDLDSFTTTLRNELAEAWGQNPTAMRVENLTELARYQRYIHGPAVGEIISSRARKLFVGLIDAGVQMPALNKEAQNEVTTHGA